MSVSGSSISPSRRWLIVCCDVVIQGKSMKLSFKGDKKVKKTKRARDPTSDDDGEGASSSSRRKSKKRDEISNPGGKCSDRSMLGIWLMGDGGRYRADGCLLRLALPPSTVHPSFSLGLP